MISNSDIGDNRGRAENVCFDVKPLNRSLLPQIESKIDNLNKPLKSLGRLEELAAQIALVQQSLTPTLTHPCHILYGADHGIEAEGVSASPREVTWQQMINFTKGGGGVNMFCRQHNIDLFIVDVGVDYDFHAIQGIIDKKIARGTANFLHAPAMTPQQMNQALEIGAEMADCAINQGCRIVSLGEMGIANTSASSLWMSLLCNIPLTECIGAGSGLSSAGVEHKYNILKAALQNFQTHKPNCSTTDIISYFGGFEMVAAIGSILRAAERGGVTVIDGFIISACALAAIKLCPNAKEYMIFAHCGNESGHKKLLDYLEVRPILNLGLRLGEGTGALCAYPIIDSAVRMINQMNNFENANITKYF